MARLLRSIRHVASSSLPFFLALAAYLWAFALMPHTTSGDEPHYLVFAHGLAFEGSVNLRALDGSGTMRLYHPTASIADHAFDFRSDGSLISRHPPGLPALIAPLLRLGAGITGTRLFMVLLAALLSHQIFRLLEETDPGSPRLLWLSWSAVAFCAPMVLYSNQIYPETAAGLLIVASLRLVSAPPAWWRLVAASAAAAALPWFQTRFGLIALPLGVAAVIRARRAFGWSGSCAVLAAWGLSLVGLAVTSHIWYGSFLPGAAQVIGAKYGFSFKPVQTYEFGLGGLLSPTFGLLPFAPVLALGLCSGAALLRRGGVAGTTAVAVICYLFATTISPAHPYGCYPGRFWIGLLPLLALCLLALVDRVAWTRVLFFALLAISLSITIAVVPHAKELFTRQGSPVTAPVVRSLEPLWPRFDFPFVSRPSSSPGRLGDSLETAFWLLALSGFALYVARQPDFLGAFGSPAPEAPSRPSRPQDLG